METKPLPIWVVPVVELAIAPILRSQVVSKIPDLRFRNVADGAVTALVGTAKVLSDDITDNKRQLTLIWRDYANMTVVPNVGDVLNELVQDIDNESLKVLAQEALPLALAIALVLTDPIPDNQAQLKVELSTYLNSDPMRVNRLVTGVLKPLMLDLGVGEGIINSVLPVVILLLQGLVGSLSESKRLSAV